MKKPHSLSPITIVEQLLFEKLGNTPVRVWHYCVLLALLFVVPIFLPSSIFTNEAYFGIFGILLIAVWMANRLVGRQLSKTSSVDSVLIYRFFAALPWIAATTLGTIALYMHTYNQTERTWAIVFLAISALVCGMHIVGIILHLKSLNKTIRNVNKEDLFQ